MDADPENLEEYRARSILGVVAARNPSGVRDAFLPYLRTLAEAGFDLNPNLRFRTITGVGEKRTRFKEIPDTFWNPDKIISAWERERPIRSWPNLRAGYERRGSQRSSEFQGQGCHELQDGVRGGGADKTNDPEF